MIKMKYKGFEFSINPSSVKMNFSKSIATKTLPFSRSVTQEICRKPVKISADGKFTGAGALSVYYELMRIYSKKGSAYLFLPDCVPIKAFFKALDISYDASQCCVSYRVEFVEDSVNRRERHDFGFTYALAGENVYDIANRTNTGIEKIVKANNFIDLFSVSEGDKIWLK